MEVLFKIGGVNIYLFGLTLGLGFIAGCIVAGLEARRKNLNVTRIIDLAVYATLVSLLFARLTYVLLEWDYYSSFPAEILKVHGGGFSFYGGLVGGILFAAMFARFSRISLRILGDVLAPGLALGYAVARVGCDIFGKPAAIPWAVQIGVEYLHPVQAYSIIAGYSIFGILCALRRRTTYDGQLMVGFLFLYGISRFVIEFFRSNESVWLLSPAQWFSLLVAGSAVIAHSRWVGTGSRKIGPGSWNRGIRPSSSRYGRVMGWVRWSAGLAILLILYRARL